MFRKRRRCPFCAENIDAEAVKCRYCHETVPPVIATVVPTKVPSAEGKEAEFFPGITIPSEDVSCTDAAAIRRHGKNLAIHGIWLSVGAVVVVFATIAVVGPQMLETGKGQHTWRLLAWFPFFALIVPGLVFSMRGLFQAFSGTYLSRRRGIRHQALAFGAFGLWILVVGPCFAIGCLTVGPDALKSNPTNARAVPVAPGSAELRRLLTFTETRLHPTMRRVAVAVEQRVVDQQLVKDLRSAAEDVESLWVAAAPFVPENSRSDFRLGGSVLRKMLAGIADDFAVENFAQVASAPTIREWIRKDEESVREIRALLTK